MSSYWSAVSGVALVLNEKETENFFKKYLSENFKNGDKVTESDLEDMYCMISDNGWNDTPFFRSACRECMRLSFPTLEASMDANSDKVLKNIFTAMMYDESEYSGGICYDFSEESDRFDEVSDGSLVIFTI